MFKLIVFATFVYFGFVSCTNLYTSNHEFLNEIPKVDDEYMNCPVIETTSGKLQGVSKSCSLLLCTYCKHAGIPYAQPPVGNLRFKAPLPHPGWEGVRDVSKHGNGCGKKEDCLFLNVYTKKFKKRLPVMVWIHGGSFNSGSGNTLVYGPDYIVDSGIVMVSINYRLGIVGFMSTGDSNSPGNYGLKDIVLALKWIKANIAKFGGDPDNITIFGESAGGAAVHYLLLSQNARGLITRAISQSGSALNPWAYQTNTADVAHQLGRDLNLTWVDNSDLVNKLRQLSLKELNAASPGKLDYPLPRGLLPIPFVPCTDPADTPEDEVFLPRTPIDIMTSGDFLKVPYITGSNSDESLFMVHEVLLDRKIFDKLNKNPSLLIPYSWNIPEGSVQEQEIINEIRNFYFYGKPLSKDLLYEYSMYNTDAMFVHGIDQTAKLHAKHLSPPPVYYYQFSFVGAFNIIKSVLLLHGYPGAVHADDLLYFFHPSPIPNLPLPLPEAKLTRSRMVRMWTNFAKNGNPTPFGDDIATTKWPNVSDNQEFLQINTTLTVGNYPNRDRIAFWNRLQETYAPIK